MFRPYSKDIENSTKLYKPLLALLIPYYKSYVVLQKSKRRHHGQVHTQEPSTTEPTKGILQHSELIRRAGQSEQGSHSHKDSQR